jgi:NIPSNAP
MITVIYEFRTYCLKPGGIPGFERQFAAAVGARQKYSKMFAFWRSELGRLNQIVHVWPYESLSAREEVRAEAKNDPLWPPAGTTPFFGGLMNSEIYRPVPFMPTESVATDHRYKYFEMFIDTYSAHTIGAAVDGWSEYVDSRTKLSPMIGCWQSEFATLNRLLHVWAYDSLDERMDVMQQAARLERPEGMDHGLVEQESKVLTSSSFSPI